MAWTQADLDALNRAIATGAREVEFADGRKVAYRSLADMRSIRDEIAVAVGAAAPRPRVTFAEHCRD